MTALEISTAEEIRTIGSTKARVYTPPLPEHCGPTGELLPEWSWGYDCIDFLENVCKWKLLPWQKWAYINALEKGADGTGFRYQIVVVMVARQNGKSQWLRGLGLWRLFLNKFGRSSPHCPAARLALIAAQNLSYSEGLLREVVDEVRDNPLLRKELVNHRETNGQHRLILTNRRYWRAATASRKGARSLSVDLAELDELREHTTWDAWNAIVPTTTARPYAQVVCASNAGDQRSEVLRSLKDSCTRRILTKDTEKTRTGYFEWSVPPDVDPRDESYWYMANPSMGLLNDFTIDDLRGFLEAMEYRNLPGFQTENLCMWVDSLEPGILPAEHWEMTLDPDSRRAPDAPVYACVDVNYDRTRSYVAIAAKRPDNRIHFEVVAAARGTDWLAPWFAERKGKFEAVGVQKVGAPASVLIPELEEVGAPIVPIAQGIEMQSVSGQFYDAIVQHQAMHRPALVLDRAAASTVGRTNGDAFVFDRRNSPVDAAPLVAAAGAVWLLQNPPKTVVPTVHTWPDEEEIAQWEKNQ